MRRLFLNKGLLALFLVCLSISALTGFELINVLATPAPSINAVCTPGACTRMPICTETAYVDPSGPTYLVRDQTGDNIYTGTNAATVLQSMLNDIAPAAPTTGKNGCISSGLYPIGATGLSIGTDALYWGLYFEHRANITYTGASYAISLISATRGGIKFFTISNPQIYSTSGCLQINGGYLFSIIDPWLQCQKVALDLDNLNTGKVIGGGYITNPGNPNVAGSIGIRLGATSTTNNVEIDVNQISDMQYGISMGKSASASIGIQQIYIHGTYFSRNNEAIEVYTANDLIIESNNFEAQIHAAINITSITGSNTPSVVNILWNYFTENPGVLNLNAPSNNFLFNLNMIQNTLGAGNIALGGNPTGTIEITGSTGTLTIPASDAINIIFNPDPQLGQVTGITTASTGLKTGAVTFARAYPTGWKYKVFMTLTIPTDTTARFGGEWTSAVSNTGFTWNVAVTTAGAGGSTVALDWMVKLSLN